MPKFNVQQKATILNYRSTHKLGFVVTDEYIAKLIKKEMEQTGVVYAGFESLAKSVAKSHIKQPTQTTNANAKTNSAVFIFGTQIVDNEFDLRFSGKTTNTYPKIQPTESQSEAINFLKDITSDAETTFKEREAEAGVLSTTINAGHEVINWWRKTFENRQNDYAKSTVKKELQVAKEDLKLLEQASKGQVGYTDFLGNTHIRSFEDVFKQRRGVKFDEKAIADCTEKAEQFAAIKTSVEMIKQTKQILGSTTKGDVHSQMNPQKASSAIIKAFQLSGINSLEKMNKTLQDIEQKYKNHPDIQKYGGGFKFAKNKQGQYVIYRIAKNGYPAEATNEQLRVIAKEMGLRLDKALATALGVGYSKNATSEEMANLTQQTYDKYKKEYEDSFAKAYGKKDVKALAEAYVLKQQQGVANIEMGLNIASMALMVVPGGAVATSGWALKGALLAKHSATGAKVVKGLQLVDKAKTFVKGAQTLQKVSQVASPFIMANMTLRPTELLEQLTSKNGMSAEEWKAWGQGVLQNSVYMAAGMGASKLAETGAAMYKTKALVSTLKSAGKSTDEIMAMIKANPVKFPNEVVKSLNKVDTLAKTLQVTSEVALDIGSTVLVNKAMGNEDLLPQDVINSIAFAISGGVLQKQFAPLSTEAKVSFIEKALKEYGVTKVEAERILKTMDDISAGKIRAKDIKPLDGHHSTQMLDEVVVTAKRNITEADGQRYSINDVAETSVALQTKKYKWTPEKGIKAIEDMCPAGVRKESFAKPFIEAIPNMDMANMDLYLEVIKTAIDYNMNAKNSIVNNGYLSSKEGAETFLKLKEMFPYDAKRARDFLRQKLDLAVNFIEAKNLQSAIDRGLFKKYGDDYSRINLVAGYTEKQYAQMAEFKAQGIEYISDNNEINRLLLAYGKKENLPYVLEKFSNDLIKMYENDETALKSAVDKLISYDNHKVILTFNEVQDKKFALDNMDDLILFEQRLTSALDEAKLPGLDSLWVKFYDVKTCYGNDSIKTLLEIFKSGKFSDLEVAKIALKAKTGNAEYLDFISKLTKSDLDSEIIVNLIEKICMPTYDRKFAGKDAWYEAEEYPLKLDLYNALKALDTKTKQVLKSCGYDVEAVLKDLSVMFDGTIAVSDVSVKNQRNYVQNVLSNNNPTAENVFKNFDFSQFGEQGLPLKYTRVDFNSNVENILSTLNVEEQNMLLQHFGLKRGVVGFEGLPSNKPFEGNGSTQIMQAAAKIQQEIENFTLKNEVMINDPEAKSVFDALIQGFPEFTSIVSKVQHRTHAYTVDIHTLKVLQDVMNDPYYNRLSDTDKTVVKFAVLMHDFGKRGGIVDTGHATLSTDYASSILERYPFSSELKQRITDTVKLHHWFEAYNKGEATAMDVAINCRNKADYYIMRMFAKADLGNVNPTFHLGRISQGARNQAEFDAFFERQMQPIGDARMQINSKSSPIYTSRFVKNGEMFSRETAVVNGQTREYRVLNLSQLSAGEDLQKYGFAPGTTKENFAMLSHMTEDNSASLESVIKVMLDPNKDSSWSLSLFNDEYNQFFCDRRCGIIVDTELKNIVDASKENMQSGTKKNTEHAVTSFDLALRFNIDPQSKTIFLKSLRKNGIKLNDYEYAEVMDTLLDNKWQSQNNKDVILSSGVVLKVDVLQQALDGVRDSIIGSNQNEVVARKPIPAALMYRAQSLSDCPDWFLELADKYNLSIILKK